VFINSDVVKHYVAMQDLIRDAEDRVEQKTAELAATDDAADKISRDRIAHELVQVTTELKLLGIAAALDVTGRNNQTLTGILESARQGASGDFRDIENRVKSFERMLKQDSENVRFTPEIEQAIIAASIQGFSNTQDKGLQKVAGYVEKPSSVTETQESIERSDASGSFVNNSESESAVETRDNGQSGRISANTDDDKKSASRDARNNIVAAKGLLKKKSAAPKKPEAANNIARFVRRKQEQDLVAAGRNRDSNSNNDGDDKGGAS
jgi:hypothetical protein